MGIGAHIVITHEQSSPPDAERDVYIERQILDCSYPEYGGGYAYVPKSPSLIAFILTRFGIPGSDFYIQIPDQAHKNWVRVKDDDIKRSSHILLVKGDESVRYMFKLEYKGNW